MGELDGGSEARHVTLKPISAYKLVFYSNRQQVLVRHLEEARMRQLAIKPLRDALDLKREREREVRRRA